MTEWKDIHLVTIPIKAICPMGCPSFVKHPVFVTADIYCPKCGRKCHTESAPRGVAHVEAEESA